MYKRLNNCKLSETAIEEYLCDSLPHMQGRYFFNLPVGHENSPDFKEKMEFYKLKIPENDFVVIIIEIDNYHKHFKNNLSENGFSYLKFILETANNIFVNDTLFYHNINDSVIGICDVRDIYQKIKLLQSQFSKAKGLTLSASVSSSGKNHGRILTMRNEAMLAIKQRVFLGSESIIYYKNIKEFCKESCKNHVCDIDKVLALILNKGKKDTAAEIDKIFAKFENTMVCDHEYVNKMCLEILFALEKALGNHEITMNKFLNKQGKSIFEIISKTDSLEHKKEWLLETIFAFKASVYNKKQIIMSPSVRAATDYIKNNYMKNSISLEAVARVVGKNPAYLCNLFKIETGKNLAKYITELRVSKSKELLSNPNCKIYEAAAQVGYIDVSHFTKTFKKHIGMKPSEYRKLILKV